MATTEAPERARGQRREHAPRTADGTLHEPSPEVEEGPHNYSEDVDEPSYGDVRTEFKEDGAAPTDEAIHEPYIVQGETQQRHGCVEQRKGVSIRDEAGNVISVSEQWRCQCKERFLGKNLAATEALYMAHIRKYDPDVPPPKPVRHKD